jgi:hypothetical protein
MPEPTEFWPLTAIALESQAVMRAAGLQPTVTDLLACARLVWLAEMRELDFVASVRGEQPTVN